MTTAERTARALLATAQPRSYTLDRRGVKIAALDWGGDGPLMLLHHANGFCKGTWALVADALRARWHVIAIDARGHGDSTKPEGSAAYEWDQFAEDLVALSEQVIAASGAQTIALGVGHSFGGTTMLGAAARQAALFERLLLVDPVTPPPPVTTLSPQRHGHMQRLVEGARRRRLHWASRAAARAWCASRALFADWQPEAIELYLLDGMHQRADGALELKCPGAIEAAVFAGSTHIDVFALVRRVRVPTLFLHAARGDFPLPLYEMLAASMPEARVEGVDSGHLVPMERPELVIDAVQRLAG